MPYKPPRKNTPTISTSVLFKFTPHEHRTINAPFRLSLSNLGKGIGTQSDWFNVTFRIKSSLLVAHEWHEDITISQLQMVYEMCEAVEARSALTDHTVWEATEEELGWFAAGFDAAEEMQKTVHRKLFFGKCAQADKELRAKYVDFDKWRRNPSRFLKSSQAVEEAEHV